MKIIAPSQLNNYKILEEVLEEIYLSIVERIQEVGDTLDLYSLSSSNILNKLGILGFENISIGHYLSLNVDDNYYKYVSPLFYKAFRKLNQHRGNKQSLDYILHSGNLIDTLNKSNNDYVKDNIFSDSASFFDFESFRDNQFEFSDIGDGYIIVPYVSKGGQKFKNFLAQNPLIFNYLPAGYTFIFLSDYRNAFFNGVLQYDNLLNTEDEYNDWSNIPLENDVFWELPTKFGVEEEIEYKEDEYKLYKRDLYYYDPEKSSSNYFEDFGKNFTIIFHPRFPNQSIYNYSSFKDIYGGSIGYIDGLNEEKDEEAYKNYLTGMSEASINNQLEYSDVWQGDYLEGSLENENVIPETRDHVRGIKSIHSPENSFLSMFSRGESLYDRYKSRYLDIVAKNNPNDGIPKEEIISDYQYIDCFVSQYVAPHDLGNIRQKTAIRNTVIFIPKLDINAFIPSFIPDPKRPVTSLFNAIDIVAGTDEQCAESPAIELVDKGGEMFTSNKQLETIAPYNSYQTVDKGGEMFTSNKQLETMPVKGVESIMLPVEEFGEIIPVFFSTNGVDSPQITLDYSDRPVFDMIGNPVYIEEGWIYQSSDDDWMWSIPNTSVLATTQSFPLANNSVAVLNSLTPGNAAQMFSSQQILAQGAYLFRAKEKFYTAWPVLDANEAKSIAPGESVVLYAKRTGQLNSSWTASLKLRAAFNQYAEYLDIPTLEIVNDVNNTYLKNNGTEVVDVYCLIFSD